MSESANNDFFILSSEYTHQAMTLPEEIFWFQQNAIF